MGFWDDLYIYSGTSQGVYYGTTGSSPNRSFVFEFYTAKYSSSTQYNHFQIVFYESLPNIVSYLYYQVADGGSSATIGVQSRFIIARFHIFLVNSFFFLIKVLEVVQA